MVVGNKRKAVIAWNPAAVENESARTKFVAKLRTVCEQWEVRKYPVI